MKLYITTLLSTSLLWVSFSAFSIEGESIVFNPVTGNYLITYQNSNDNSFRQVTFIPSIKINPILYSKLRLEKNGIIQYGYSLFSGRDSRQDIIRFSIDPVSSVTTSLPDVPYTSYTIPNTQTEQDAMIVAITQAEDNMSKIAEHFVTPPRWNAYMNSEPNSRIFRIGWNTKGANGVRPGQQATFGFNSRDLPGIFQAKMNGYAPGSKKIPGEETQDAEDGAFGQQYTELVFRKNFIYRNAAVPAITVPTPFNAAVLLDRIQAQTHTWIAMQLLDASFSSQLDRYLTAAANAYRLNQPKAGKEHIQTLRKMLKKEHEDTDKDDDKEDGKHEGKSDDKSKRLPIDRLAARVLDFNLKYVLKRMGGED